MKTCPNCHAQLDDNAIFCTACGTQFGAVPPQQNAIPPQQNAIRQIVKSSATLFRQKFERGKIAKTFARTTIN